MLDRGSDSIDVYAQRVLDGVSKLKGLDIGDEIEVEILGQLVRGRRTVTEMVAGGLGSPSRSW